MIPTTPIGWILAGVSAIVLTVATAVGVLVILVFVGGPSAEAVCGERALELNVSADRAFDPRWDGFDAFLDTGVPDALDLEEDVVTARARAFLTVEHDIDEIEDLVICFFGPESPGELGQAEVRGRVSIPVLPDVSASIRGSMDLTGEAPVLDLTDIDLGSVPGFVISGVESAIEDAINEALEDVSLRHRYNLEFRDGFARVNGQPR